MKNREKPPITSDIISKKLELYCAYQERCIKDVTSKLKDWNLRENQIEKIIAKLKADNFLNEERFAKAYARGKFNVNKWGRQRIAFELHLKNIPANLIQAGLSEINQTEYLKMLKQLILKKKKESDTSKSTAQTMVEIEKLPGLPRNFIIPLHKNGSDKNLTNRDKIINFVHNKGYEMNLILVIINELKI